MTTGKSERLAVLSSAEQDALYGLPDFDDTQRMKGTSPSRASRAP
jgi:hypothetical protein